MEGLRRLSPGSAIEGRCLGRVRGVGPGGDVAPVPGGEAI